MTDIALIWQGIGADIVLDGTDLVVDEGLETSVILSLFVDRRADDGDELPDGVLSKGGYFGDVLASERNDKRGSRLWLLRRETKRSVVLERARAYCQEALSWMIEDGVASRVAIETSFEDGRDPGETVLLIDIDIYKPQGSGLERFRYAYNWEQQFFSRAE